MEDGSIEIKEGATIIFGFAGVGLIGPIIANTLIEQISDVKEIGYITSQELPPIAVFYDGKLKHPFRLLYSKEKNIIIGICEVPFKSESAYDNLSETMCKWALSDKIKAREIVTFQGMARRDIPDEFPVYFASEDGKIKDLENLEMEKLNRGIIIGPEATLLNRALMNKIDAYALFTPVTRYPTPEGAAAIIEVLNKIYNLDIDTSKLIEKGKKIKKKMADLAEQAQQMQQKQLASQAQKYPDLYQ
ncbi:MAG: PAC2 family protein [Promethearchaeota archaeon]|nr:MAG: PAC2 family protein [Candidatus Lokiarchaeota archaeon]